MSKPVTGRPPGRPPKVGQSVNKTYDNGLSKSPINMDEVPEAPDDLSELGAALWYRLWLSNSTHLEESDGFLVQELCQIYEEKEFVRLALSSGSVPLVYRVNGGQINNHPFVKQLADKRVQMNTLISSLGFSPADRARLGVANALAEDPQVAALLNRREARHAANDAKREDNK